MNKLIGLALFVAMGCNAHNAMRGSVVMKVSDIDAHVCLGQDEVKKGEPIRLYKNVCADRVGGVPKVGSIPVQSCKKELAGEGQVAEVLNSHYSVVRFPQGTQFQEGDTVETLKR